MNAWKGRAALKGGAPFELYRREYKIRITLAKATNGEISKWEKKKNNNGEIRFNPFIIKHPTVTNEINFQMSEDHTKWTVGC